MVNSKNTPLVNVLEISQRFEPQQLQRNCFKNPKNLIFLQHFRQGIVGPRSSTFPIFVEINVGSWGLSCHPRAAGEWLWTMWVFQEPEWTQKPAGKRWQEEDQVDWNYPFFFPEAFQQKMKLENSKSPFGSVCDIHESSVLFPSEGISLHPFHPFLCTQGFFFLEPACNLQEKKVIFWNSQGNLLMFWTCLENILIFFPP